MAVMSLGKFQGSETWVPYYYEQLQLGFADDEMEDEGGNAVAFFRVQAEDVAVFPELAGCDRVYITENSDGFVSGKKLAPGEQEQPSARC